jgi:hypothetical protein
MLPGDPFRTFDIRAPQFVEEFHVIVDVKSAARPSDLRRSSTADDRSPRAARPTSNRLRAGDGATLVLLACGASSPSPSRTWPGAACSSRAGGYCAVPGP